MNEIVPVSAPATVQPKDTPTLPRIIVLAAALLLDIDAPEPEETDSELHKAVHAVANQPGAYHLEADQIARALASDLKVAEMDIPSMGQRQTTMFVFEHDGEFAVCEVEYPEYCDDESDGACWVLWYSGDDPRTRMRSVLGDSLNYLQQVLKAADEEVTRLFGVVGARMKPLVAIEPVPAQE